MTSVRRRKPTRLQVYDYTQSGIYFITICTHDRLPLFGRIMDAEMYLSKAGQIVAEEWQQTAIIRPYVELDVFVVMPNHFHGLLILDGRETTGQGATRRVAPTLAAESLGAIIGQFKSVVTKRIRSMPYSDPAAMIWQRGYHDHIVRSEADLDRIREYIASNPARWTEDRYYGKT